MSDLNSHPSIQIGGKKTKKQAVGSQMNDLTWLNALLLHLRRLDRGSCRHLLLFLFLIFLLLLLFFFLLLLLLLRGQLPLFTHSVLVGRGLVKVPAQQNLVQTLLQCLVWRNRAGLVLG